MSCYDRKPNGLSAAFQFALVLHLSSEPRIECISRHSFNAVNSVGDAEATVKMLCKVYREDRYKTLREEFLLRIDTLGYADTIRPMLESAERKLVLHAA